MAEIKTEIGDPIGGYCKYCNGSGESSTLSGGGPDAYEVPINCPKCDGTGERRVLTDTQIENMFFGEIDNRTLSFARAIEAAVLSANAGKVDDTRYKDLLAAVIAEIPHRKRGWRGNAPGHGHSVLGIWDSDNGALAGKPCAWCRVWNEANQLLEDSAPSPTQQASDAGKV